MTLNEVMKDTAEAIREKTGKSELIAPVDFASEIKGITAGGGESGGSNVEYLDLSGDSPLRDTLIQFCYLIKIDGFKIERPDGSSSSAGRAINPASVLLQLMIDSPYEEYLIILGSIKAVSIDFNTEVIIDGTDTIMPIKDLFTGAEELLDAIPRLTKEEFYDLNA